MDEASEVAAEFRRHFDQYYLGVIPRLFTDEGRILAFVSMLTAIESLAGAFAPSLGAGDRFQKFLVAYFPAAYHIHVAELWQFRNHMIHSFNPTPFLLVCHCSRMHLQCADGVEMLNVEDFYADTVIASRSYFRDLYSQSSLQHRFNKRVTQSDGGRITASQVVERS